MRIVADLLLTIWTVTFIISFWVHIIKQIEEGKNKKRIKELTSFIYENLHKRNDLVDDILDDDVELSSRLKERKKQIEQDAKEFYDEHINTFKSKCSKK